MERKIENFTTHPVELVDACTGEQFAFDKLHKACRANTVKTNNVSTILDTGSGHFVRVREMLLTGTIYDAKDPDTIRIVSLATVLAAMATGMDTSNYLIPVAPSTHSVTHRMPELLRLKLAKDGSNEN